jgi:hypothetical protein
MDMQHGHGCAAWTSMQHFFLLHMFIELFFNLYIDATWIRTSSMEIDMDM